MAGKMILHSYTRIARMLKILTVKPIMLKQKLEMIGNPEESQITGMPVKFKQWNGVKLWNRLQCKVHLQKYVLK